MTEAPNRDRWDGWVTFAWLLAVLACIGGVSVIAMAGFVEVPRESSFGGTSYSREPNVFIWAVGIGQAISALLLAALFSMINSIYKNSCELLADREGMELGRDKETGNHIGRPDSGNSTDMYHETDKNNVLRGPKIVKISDQSPLFDRAYVDWSLAEINGKRISVSKDIRSALSLGENNFTFTKPDGEVVQITANVKAEKRLYMTLSR